METYPLSDEMTESTHMMTYSPSPSVLTFCRQDLGQIMSAKTSNPKCGHFERLKREKDLKETAAFTKYDASTGLYLYIYIYNIYYME